MTAVTIELIRNGAAAIPQVATALLFGKPSSVSQPRCALVSVLATLGANDVLLKYLSNYCSVEDPLVRLAEDDVVNAAARAMKLDFSAEAYCALLNIAEKRDLSGVLESLALYRRTESIPYFIRALEGDLSRAAAAECLRGFGDRAKPFLLREVFRREPDLPERESASSLYRRRACADVLASARLTSSEQEALLDLLFETDAERVVNIGTILLISDNPWHQHAALRRLRAIRSHADWLWQDELDVLVGRLEQKVGKQ